MVECIGAESFLPRLTRLKSRSRSKVETFLCYFPQQVLLFLSKLDLAIA